MSMKKLLLILFAIIPFFIFGQRHDFNITNVKITKVVTIKSNKTDTIIPKGYSCISFYIHNKMCKVEIHVNKTNVSFYFNVNDYSDHIINGFYVKSSLDIESKKKIKQNSKFISRLDFIEFKSDENYIMFIYKNKRVKYISNE